MRSIAEEAIVIPRTFRMKRIFESCYARLAGQMVRNLGMEPGDHFENGLAKQDVMIVLILEIGQDAEDQ